MDLWKTLNMAQKTTRFVHMYNITCELALTKVSGFVYV